MVDERLRKALLLVLPTLTVVTLIGVGLSGMYFKDDVEVGNIVLLISLIGAALLTFLSLLFRKKAKGVTGIVLVFVLAVPVLFYFVNKPTTTSFGAALPDEIISAEVISEMKIYSERGRPFKSVTLENPDERKRILQKPSTMTLVTSDEGLPQHLYSIWIQGDSYENEIQIIVGQEAIRILGSIDGEDVGGEYEIEGGNRLLQVIENGELDWKEG
ncbi:hypothetical protein VKA52_13100 [Halobacillus sp. HZG1]|uniref:hypothetical protein n=1 Tax=Halobacillus sp. HZG1 TaxID=3111769 RepID=UPI002DB655DA|nr:hypothetical protein [Halobacillus sp. HZG1]MEC3884663.1 hypothetical protein [Halobacillus sp. HZG1]